MITIAEVIEQCAKECEEMGRAYAVRTLKQRYEGCIVAEGERVRVMVGLREDLPLYRAKQLETCKPALQVEEVEPVAHRHEWFRTGAMEPGQMRCIECGEWRCEAAPPARRPLTDEEIWDIAANCLNSVAGQLQFARAIERAHKIGGNDD